MGRCCEGGTLPCEGLTNYKICKLVCDVVKDNPDGIKYPDIVREMRRRGCTVKNLARKAQHSLKCLVSEGVAIRNEEDQERTYTFAK